MKKTIYMLLLASATLASCSSDDYGWEGVPQSSPAEQAQTAYFDNSTIQEVNPINLEEVTNNEINICRFQAPTVTDPDASTTYTVTFPKQERGTVDKTLDLTADGFVSTTGLTDVVTTYYGLVNKQRTLPAFITAIVKTSAGQAITITSKSFNVYVTPKVPDFMEFYVVGEVNSWNDKAEGKKLYMIPSKKGIYSYTTNFAGKNGQNLKIWNGEDYGKWDNALGSKNDNDASESGTIVDKKAGAIVCPGTGYYTFTYNFNEGTYSWTKIANQNPATYDVIDIAGDFNSWGATPLNMTQGAPHNWYVELSNTKDGSLKFRANNAWDVNWGIPDFLYDAKNHFYGVGQSNGDNIKLPAGKYDVYFNDITGEFAFLAK